MRHVCRCHPSHIYTWTNAELQAWYDHHGAHMLHDGRAYELHTNKLKTNQHSVKFVISPGIVVGAGQ